MKITPPDGRPVPRLSGTGIGGVRTGTLPITSDGSWAGNGIRNTATTGRSFVASSLRVLHDGIDVTNRVEALDAATGDYRLSYAPRNGARMRHYYWAA